LGCWGCRGPAPEPNFKELIELTKREGFSKEEIQERMKFFGAFEETEYVKEINSN
jgi:hypothetical protein